MVTETPESRKRPRAESSEKQTGDATDASKAKTNAEETPAPAYGSQEYWEDRYKTNKAGEEDSREEDDPDPNHAWYFKFDDLAPILLPLIVGTSSGDEDEVDDDDDNTEGIENDETDVPVSDETPKISNEISPQTIDALQSDGDPTKLPLQHNLYNAEKYDDVETKIKNSVEAGEESDVESFEEIEGYEIAEMDEEDEDDSQSGATRAGLARNGPISVLEVGCGDAPLGPGLALAIKKYGSDSGKDPSTILRKIVCLDYSQNVINTMKQEQQQQLLQSNDKAIPVDYEAGDARKLSYENESFEVILEKGTLDAMLSDSDGKGQTNCRKIVSECARVLAIGGYIIIISHLNAYVESGLEWLNSVVVPGLRASGKFEWLIEVHGSDVEIPSDVDGDEDADEKKPIESPGPAVYFIEKVGLLDKAKASDSGDQELPTIPLKFFSY